MSDFGLSKSLYEKMYFRQDTSEGVKLPIKWMALESMHDAVFSEKSDVVSTHITCKLIFYNLIIIIKFMRSPYYHICSL